MLGDIVFPSTMFRRCGPLNLMVFGGGFHAVSTNTKVCFNKILIQILMVDMYC